MLPAATRCQQIYITMGPTAWLGLDSALPGLASQPFGNHRKAAVRAELCRALLLVQDATCATAHAAAWPRWLSACCAIQQSEPDCFYRETATLPGHASRQLSSSVWPKEDSAEAPSLTKEAQHWFVRVVAASDVLSGPSCGT